VVVDHRRKRREGSGTLGVLLVEYPYSAYVLQNPAISGRGNTEEEAVEAVRKALLTVDKFDLGKESRKVVELDIADEMTVRDVMEG